MVLLCFTVDMVLLWDGHRAAQLWPHVLNMAPAAAGNEFGQIGDGTVLPRMTAVAIASDIVSVSAGRRIYELRNCRWFRETLNIVEETCGQMWDHVANIPEHDLWGWWHTLAVTATGEIFAWGQNKQGPSRTLSMSRDDHVSRPGEFIVYVESKSMVHLLRKNMIKLHCDVYL